jgi:hypothetical protein
MTKKATEKLGKVHGKCKMLFIGISYFSQKGELCSCINDIKSFLFLHCELDENLVLTGVSSGLASSSFICCFVLTPLISLAFLINRS